MGLFGPPQMVLTLEKYNYKPGEIIKGTVKVQLKKPMNAEKLEVGFIGKKIQQQSTYHGSRYQKSTQHCTVYDFRMPLGGQQEYLEGIYPFEIKIPETILQSESTLEGNVATAVNVLKTLSGISSRIEWMVVARLDLPMKLDVSASQKIVLS
ncbi:MAG: hypothetical protein JXA75_00975 [Candidatus Thermoplasmatota archaeon]|nr:hypothetical protein [Candidatus Thermoplasmatota archaeon]